MNRASRRAGLSEKERTYTVTESQLHRMASEKAKKLLSEDLERIRNDTINLVFDLYTASMKIAMNDALGIGPKRMQKVLKKYEELVKGVERGEVTDKHIFELANNLNNWRKWKIKLPKQEE